MNIARISIVWTVTAILGAQSQKIRCVAPGICRTEEEGSEFECLEQQYECCRRPGEILELVEAPRGTACCQGAGMFEVQTHQCNGNRIVKRSETVFCPNSRIEYNVKSETCCRGPNSTEPTVHFIEVGGSCCGSDYIINSAQGCCDHVPYNKEDQCCKDLNVVPKSSCDEEDLRYDGSITCLPQDIQACKDGTTGEFFKCIERQYECCTLADNRPHLFMSPRGMQCCEGAGMYHMQTHECISRQIVRKSGTQLCPESSTYFNNETQICCRAGTEEPKVFMKEAGRMCCGQSYIPTTTQGCCDGVSYDSSNFCCLNNKVTSKEICEIRDPDCPEIDCSRGDEKVLKTSGANRPMFVYSLKAGSLIRTDDDFHHFKVTHIKQLRGIKKGKVAPIPSKRIKRVSLPKCGCYARLQKGQYYILLTKSRLRSHTVRLHKGKFSLAPVQNSAAFRKLFNE